VPWGSLRFIREQRFFVTVNLTVFRLSYIKSVHHRTGDWMIVGTSKA